ncbi:MAG: hypothetical protein KKA07_05030 [Bacteroidetes bacterium]|nr:hypothetical protein [Bacteroidota bacterium]MBU1718416.1 hypothetical protein [Bacteroidota bacterium]
MTYFREFKALGYFSKTTGNRGELIMQVSDPVSSFFDNAAFLFVELDTFRVPFEVAELEERGDGRYKILLVDVDADEASKLCGKNTYIHLTDYPDEQPKQVDDDLVGFILSNSFGGFSGEILEVTDLKHYLLARVQGEGKEVLIPLHPNLIRRVDPEKRIIVIDIPEGLTEL